MIRVLFLFLITVVISWGVSFDGIDINISKKLRISSISNWQDIDKNIQNFIIDNKQSIIDDIIINIDKPVMDSNHTINSELPKILITRDNYLILMIYLKYLIYNDKYDRVVDIYNRVINGVNGIDNYWGINVIFKIVINRIVLKSLKYDLKYLPLSSMKSLKTTNPKLFNLNPNSWRETLKRKETPYMLVNEYDIIKLSNIVSKIYNKDDTNKINISLKKLLDYYYKNFDNLYTQKDCIKSKEFLKKYNKSQKEFIAKHILDIMALHTKMKQYFNISLLSYSPNITIKVSPFIDISQILNREIKSELATQIFYYTLYKDNLYFIDTQLDLLKTIQYNKQVVKVLNNYLK